MRRQSFMLVFGALVVTLAVVGLVGIQSTSTAGNLTDHLVEETAPSLHILSHLKSAASRLVGVATQLSPQSNLTDPSIADSVTPTAVSLDAFNNAYVSFQEEVGQFQTMYDAGDPLQRSLLEAAEELLAHASTWRELIAGVDESKALLQLSQLQTAEHVFIVLVEEAIAAEAAQLVQDGELVDENARRIRLLNVATTSAAILLVVVFGGLVVHQVARMQARQEHLRAAKAELERDLAERAEQLEIANREMCLQLEQRQQAEEENVQRNRRLQGLLQVSQQLASQFTFKERLDAVVGGVLASLPTAEAASLWLYDPACKQLELRAWSGYDDDIIAGLQSPSVSDLAQLVYRNRQTRLPNGWGGISMFTIEDVLGLSNKDGHCSIIGVPLLVDENLIGVLFADSTSRVDAFDAVDLCLLQSLADQTAIAIKNAQLLDAVTQHRQELQQLSAQLIVAREEERKHISRELHDVMEQALTSVSINLAEMKQELPRDVVTILQERIEESESLTLQTLSTMRELSLELRPSMLDDLGLLPTLKWYVRQFGQRLNVVAIFKTKGVRDRLPSGLETVLYRVVQEGLTNIARHAQAQEICVYLNCDGKTLTLLITDDGKGFDVCTANGMGLLGIREWVAAIGGRLRVESAPGRGTRLTVSIRCPQLACPKKGQTRTLDKIKVLLVEDHTIMRKGLLSLLDNEPDIQVVGEAVDCREAVRLAHKLQPDVIVMDIAMPLLSGLEATRHVKRDLPETKLVVLTAHTTEEYVYQILEAGTSGYLVKQSAPDELVMAIRSACAGDTFLSPSISGDVVQEYIESAQLSEASDDYAILTDREREVFQLLAEGRSTREIAEVLVLSTKTIETHRANLMNKLDIHNLPDLTRYAIRKGVVSLE